MRIELGEAGCARDRHHEVAPRVSHQPFDLALIVALAGSSKAVGEQIVRLQLTEDSRSQPPAVAQDARHCQLGVVIQDRTRHAAEEVEADPMTITEGLAALRRIGLHQTAVAVRQVHREEVDLALHSANNRERFTEVDLSMSRIVPQGHEHLARPLAPLVHVVFDDGDPAAVAVRLAAARRPAWRCAAVWPAWPYPLPGSDR